MNKKNNFSKVNGLAIAMITVLVIVLIGVFFIMLGGKDWLRFYKLRYSLFGTDCFSGEQLWAITQYGDASGKQNSFYILTSNKGDVVVIDGGWKENSEQVLYELKRRGGKVDAWILTHPHPDHIGAFNEVYKSGEIMIKTVYDNSLDLEYYDQVDESWDEIEVYKEYLELVKGDTSIHHIEVGEAIELNGLRLKFYNAYNEDIKRAVSDICNNSSLVFTIDTDDYELLFVGDCYAENIISHILNEYSDVIMPSMAQMPHHGNSILPDIYYENLKLDVCFFDAPAWLMEDVNYSTYLHRDAMESAGAYCVDQSMAPTTLKLYLEEDQ